MKRKFKRIASLVLAAVMVFAMAMPAMAADIEAGKTTYDIHIKTDGNKVDHTYAVY